MLWLSWNKTNIPGLSSQKGQLFSLGMTQAPLHDIFGKVPFFGLFLFISSQSEPVQSKQLLWAC